MRCRICNYEVSGGERYCFNCGSLLEGNILEDEKARKPKLGWLLWVAAALVLLALLAAGFFLVHLWEEPTCTEPETCKICGKTRDEALGHSWRAATCTEPKTCAVCGKTKGTAEGHSWKDATCTDPRTCSVCKETEGDALPHTWVSATCTEPMYCSVCGSITGSALGHDWIEATYQDPRTCAACGLEEGERLGELGDIFGKWAESPVDLGDWSVYPLVLDQAVANCDCFVLYVDFEEFSEEGDWDIYVKKPDGNWSVLGRLTMLDDETWWNYDLSTGGAPVSFTQMALVPVDASFSSFGIYFELQDVHVTG